ncbi:MAG: ABC transporter permease subunit, partial [Pseudomonadota bacterium]
MTILLIYIAIFVAAFFVVRFIVSRMAKVTDFTSLKTVTFGDESAVVADRWASVISVLTLFFLWGAFTGSSLVPIHAPGPFLGQTSFTYTASDGSQSDEATVTVDVYRVGEEEGEAPEVEPGDGFAKNDSAAVGAWRSGLIRVDSNDELGRDENVIVTAINGQPIAPGETVQVDDGAVTLSARGTPNFTPYQGWQMEPIWLPSPEQVAARTAEIASTGYQNFTLWEHLFWSLVRVVVGFALGAIVGIPLGYAMGLSNWFRGWFDPIVEFMRPVPPLALIPLVIIWAGIGESGKIILLFLAALWIMTIAARAGVSGVAISKVHAAYSLGASKWQLLRYVIVPNSLPEIFTGARVAMGVCWGTVVAAELV